MVQNCIKLIAVIVGILVGLATLWQYQTQWFKESIIDVSVTPLDTGVALTCNGTYCGYESKYRVDVSNTGNDSFQYKRILFSEIENSDDQCFTPVFTPGSKTEITDMSGQVIANKGFIHPDIEDQSTFIVTHFRVLDDDVYERLVSEFVNSERALTHFAINRELDSYVKQSTAEIFNRNTPWPRYEFRVVPKNEGEPIISAVFEANTWMSDIEAYSEEKGVPNIGRCSDYVADSE